ncbi:MAG: helix-turn-helix transcriptional regulator [Gammaproteobacteria bacterium]|nr:helix-turn-helix transcriptional regulator [Gammaproteobacteria bacterium]
MDADCKVYLTPVSSPPIARPGTVRGVADTLKSIAERLEAARVAKKCSQADISRAAHVSRATVSDWFSGTIKEIAAENLFPTAEYLSVEPRWLSLGEGPMRPITLTKDESDLLFYWRKMDEEHSRAFLKLASMNRMLSHPVEPKIAPAPPLPARPQHTKKRPRRASGG